MGHTKQFGHISCYTLKIKITDLELILIHSLSQIELFSIFYFKRVKLSIFREIFNSFPKKFLQGFFLNTAFRIKHYINYKLHNS